VPHTRCGIAVARVLTDNGGGYRSRRFQAMGRPLSGAALAHAFVPTQTNRKAERFIQTLIRSGAYAVSFPAPGAGRRRCVPGSGPTTPDGPHAALGYQPPCVRFPRVPQ
jgi:hypothetical protein